MCVIPDSTIGMIRTVVNANEASNDMSPIYYTLVIEATAKARKVTTFARYITVSIFPPSEPSTSSLSSSLVFRDDPVVNSILLCKILC